MTEKIINGLEIREWELLKIKLTLNIGLIALSYYMSNAGYIPNVAAIFKIALGFYMINLFMGAFIISELNILKNIKKILWKFYNAFFDTLSMLILIIFIISSFASNWLSSIIIFITYTIVIFILIRIKDKLNKEKKRV